MVWALLTLNSGCSRYYQGPESDHFDGSRFFNPGQPMHKGFAEFLKWRLSGERGAWPRFSELARYDHPPARVEGEQLRVALVGHATVLIQTQGLNILTDPLFSERTSPVSWAGPRRVHPPGVSLEDLPPIDLIWISHNHYDHLDLVSLDHLWQRDQPRIIVPLGNDRIITAHNPAIRVEAYDWGAGVEVGPQLRVHLLPVQHWSARGLFDRNQALWAAFVLTTPRGNIFFDGDSGYGRGQAFQAARQRFGSFRLAILPIGDYSPRWFMAYGHMNPREALQAWADLGRPYMLPIHYGMFQLADTGYREPLQDLEQALAADQQAAARVQPLAAGGFWLVPLGEDVVHPEETATVDPRDGD